MTGGRLAFVWCDVHNDTAFLVYTGEELLPECCADVQDADSRGGDE